MTMLRITLLVTLFFTVITNTASATEVNISYSKGIQRYIPLLDNIERVREDRFRTRLTGGESEYNGVFANFARNDAKETNWATIRLIDSVLDYGVTNLLKELVADNISRFEDTDNLSRIDVDIERIRISGHPLVRINGPGRYVKGTVSSYDESGTLISRSEISTSELVPVAILNRPYDGEGYAFIDSRRIGPVLSHFVEQALTDLFPHEEENIYGPVFL